MNESKPDVSVVVLTYNVQWEKLRPTLESILAQQDVAFEIIMADDGSAVRLDAQTLALCHAHGFDRLLFSNCEKNGGTCKNLWYGIQQASGRYIKPFSPGDLLYDSSALRDWVTFMDKTGCEASFGDAVYYRKASDHGEIVSARSAPVQRQLFTGKPGRKLFVDYLLANDTVLGAAVMMRTERMRTDLARFVDRVIYAEDYMLRLAVFEARDIRYFARRVIWYEYGSGISTAANEKWQRLLQRDFDACNAIIAESPHRGALGKKYVRYLANSQKPGIRRKLCKCAAFPDMIAWRLRNRRGSRTPTDASLTELNRMLSGL